MIDENRLIIKKGLKIIKNTKVKGLSYLLNYLRLNKKTLTTTDVSYYIHLDKFFRKSWNLKNGSRLLF